VTGDLTPPLTPEEEAKFRESVRLLGDDGYLHWTNNVAARLLATIDAERLPTVFLPRLGQLMQPNGKGGSPEEGLRLNVGRLFDPSDDPDDAAVSSPLADIRERVEGRLAVYSRPEGKHVYLRGGIHADVTNCGECGRLHELRAILAILDSLDGAS
jgi:hypothetical protein